ncbi:MAG TPA: hypothetical protein VLD39_18715 [Gammaproteobacteria bacterium]|nr:hypothetical protein [Gammaproteobacteria bacterium]
MHVAGVGFLVLLVSGPVHAPAAEYFGSNPAARADADTDAPPPRQASSDAETAQVLDGRRYERDLDAMRRYRPGYPFWHHVFTVSSGRVAFGSAADGRLLATFPIRGDWIREAHWENGVLAELLADQPLPGGLAAYAELLADRPFAERAERREDTARLLEQAAGPVLYHETRGSFIAKGAERYGSLLAEWAAIFERFGVPAELGLAQGLVESGLRGRVRSAAEAIGFCQWLAQNWARLQQLSPAVIEAYNQTTQVPYCAAHLAVLAAKYGSFIPALSEHHAGGVNVGRTIINGQFAGGNDIRERYFLGAELTLLVRHIRPPGYRQVVGGYGPRSYRYAEMVFGNTFTVAKLQAAMPQERVFAMRPNRSIPLEEITRRTGLSVDEVRRFNPALINRVPAGANLYLPFHVDDFGDDAAFWHRAPSPEYAAALNEFMRLEERYTTDDWNDGSVFEALRAFEARFRATGTEEGVIMATVIRYVIDDLGEGRRMQILTKFRSDDRVARLLEHGVREREVLLQEAAGRGEWARRNALLTKVSLGTL